MRTGIIAFVLTALVTGAVVYTFSTSNRNHPEAVDPK
jgi:hypothetical protein